jgi:uncharacterized metal-binding protein YceD (DUF177 family)
LVRLDKDFLLRGQLTGVFVRPCDRCLREVVQMVELEVDWFFEEEQPGGAFEDAEKYTFHGHELDLAPYMWEELVLAMPAKCVCENKAGCVPAEAFAPPESGGEGAENVGAPMNPGFAKLKDMFPDIAREQRKE